MDAALVRACHSGVALAEPYVPCVGDAARACQALPGGDTTLGITECLMAETRVWEEVMLAEYERQAGELAALPGELSAQLAATQTAWRSYRDAECGLRYALWIDGSIRTIVAADCHLRKTAARAQELRDLGAME